MTEPTPDLPSDQTEPAGPSPLEDLAPVRQVNLSGSTLHVPALGIDVPHGVDVEYHDLLAGFTRLEDDLEEDLQHAEQVIAAKARRGKKPDPTPDTPGPTDATPAAVATDPTEVN